jgi:hypothetical protein
LIGCVDCSALIAQAFEAVRYPILPKVTQLEIQAARREILEIRHSSLYAPRDFDISPYFEVVKPTLVAGFNYKRMDWADLPALPQACPMLNVARHGQGLPRAADGGHRACHPKLQSLSSRV